MERLQGLVKKYWNQILDLKNVVGVGCGYKEVDNEKTDDEALVVLVEEKLDKNELESYEVVPEKVEDIDTDVIEVGELELLVPEIGQNKVNLAEIDRMKRSRPAQPGTSIGHYRISAGTFGAVVKDRKTGESLILSNNHVLANMSTGYDGRAKKGDPILQPGQHDNGERNRDVIGHLKRFSSLKRKTEPSSSAAIQGVENLLNGIGDVIKFPYLIKFVQKNKTNNLVDCAVAKPTSEDVITDQILEIGKVKGVKQPQVGMEVIKSGRTTGMTESRIKAVHATVEVSITGSEKGVFDDQIIAEPFSKPGDSGSLILDRNYNAVGLLFAGSDKSTVCNRINNVLDELKVEFV
ncbi:hypothetical protein [Sporohalobacter salinus]|uniref:hypothetical protein n=1 Tax=Sporohalobacter salinus TaxID=1494606 RepID=UPI00195F95DB|nr:hypothetical protein [Sporohalobacter salinus]MBM7623915.1 hypothetical protein [Sporohalobacter salinus]